FSLLGEASVPESFVRGLAEELIVQLGRFASDRLGIIAASSCNRMKRADRTASEIGAALNAPYLLDGTIRSVAATVRITAQLIETEGETQLWAESYDRPVTESLVIQQEVAMQIVQHVAIELAPNPRRL